MSKCDNCQILRLHTYDSSDVVHESGVITILSHEAKYGREDFTPSDFLDRRKHLTTMYNYCPNCGTKIDWENIKKRVKQHETM